MSNSRAAFLFLVSIMLLCQLNAQVDYVYQPFVSQDFRNYENTYQSYQKTKLQVQKQIKKDLFDTQESKQVSNPEQNQQQNNEQEDDTKKINIYLAVFILFTLSTFILIKYCMVSSKRGRRHSQKMLKQQILNYPNADLDKIQSEQKAIADQINFHKSRVQILEQLKIQKQYEQAEIRRKQYEIQITKNQVSLQNQRKKFRIQQQCRQMDAQNFNGRVQRHRQELIHPNFNFNQNYPIQNRVHFNRNQNMEEFSNQDMSVAYLHRDQPYNQMNNNFRPSW